MPVGFQIVNFSRKELLSFGHVNASSAHELAGNEASAAITTWYMLSRRGDRIAFVSDTYKDWPFENSSSDDLLNYRDVTAEMIQELISRQILADYGMLFVNPDEPESVFVRDLRNIWDRDNNDLLK
ncbi:MAG: hypothetical protein V4710_04900 [Verrucomicrobiota bacterium]